MATPKTLEDKKSRSIEEREHDYEKARARIFKDVCYSFSDTFQWNGILYYHLHNIRYV